MTHLSCYVDNQSIHFLYCNWYRNIPSEDADVSEMGNYYLQMHKKQGSDGFYDDGLTLVFTEIDKVTGETVL